jgi:hypothetical protein
MLIVVRNKPVRPLILLRPAGAGSVAFTGGAAAPLAMRRPLVARYAARRGYVDIGPNRTTTKMIEFRMAGATKLAR